LRVEDNGSCHATDPGVEPTPVDLSDIDLDPTKLPGLAFVKDEDTGKFKAFMTQFNNANGIPTIPYYQLATTAIESAKRLTFFEKRVLPLLENVAGGEHLAKEYVEAFPEPVGLGTAIQPPPPFRAPYNDSRQARPQQYKVCGEDAKERQNGIVNAIEQRVEKILAEAVEDDDDELKIAPPPLEDAHELEIAPPSAVGRATSPPPFPPNRPVPRKIEQEAEQTSDNGELSSEGLDGSYWSATVTRRSTKGSSRTPEKKRSPVKGRKRTRKSGEEEQDEAKKQQQEEIAKKVAEELGEDADIVKKSKSLVDLEHFNFGDPLFDDNVDFDDFGDSFGFDDIEISNPCGAGIDGHFKVDLDTLDENIYRDDVNLIPENALF